LTEDIYIKHLSWDSNFFAKKIGKIICNNPVELPNLLNKAKYDNYELIYVFGNENCYVENEIVKRYNGKLMDKKVLYQKKITGLLPLLEQIENYTGNLTKELEELAYVSGGYSRFKLDKNFRKDNFYQMYKIWIERSIKKEIADNVFVVKGDNTIKGMVTLKIEGNTGRIGLIAITLANQGKGYGKALINTCENELLRKNIVNLEVATQIDNTQACRFYEKCDFKIKEVTNIYHFWISTS